MKNNRLSKSSQRKIGVILQYMQMASSVIISLIYAPILLKTLGANEYGIYSIASSIISYLSLLSLGFGSSYLRFYSIYKNEGKNEEIKKMNGLYLLVFFGMGIIALIAGIIISKNVQIFFNSSYSIEEIKIAKVLMLVLAINLALSFPSSVFSSYITSQERFVFQKILNMGKTIFGPAFNIVFLYLGYGSIGMVICTTLFSFLVDLINVYYCFNKLEMKISFKSLDFKLLKDIAIFSIFIAINQIIDQINWQTDKVILGKVLNGTAVAIYSIGAQINSLFTQFSTAVSSVFAPKVNMIVNENDDERDKKLTNLFIKVGRIQWFVLILVLLGFIFFGQYFIYIWVGDEYKKSYYIALLLMCPATIALIQNIGIEIQRAKNKHQFRSIVYLIMAFLNVGISIWFAFLWGEIGVTIGTTISLVVANGLIMNIYYQKKLGIDVISFWKSIGQTLPGLIIPIACGVCLMMFYNFYSLFDFCLLVVAYTVVYAISIYLLGMNKEEKGMVNGIFKKVFRR